MEIACPVCGKPSGKPYEWDSVGEEYNCKNCGAKLLADMDDWYDPETGDEGWRFFAKHVEDEG